MQLQLNRGYYKSVSSLMSLLTRSALFFYKVYATLLFVLLMLLIFPFVIAVSFLGHIRGGNAIYRICMFWGDIWFPMVGILHKNIFETPHDNRQSYIFVSNHISFLDAAIVVKTHRLPVRALGKEETARIPIFGYIYKNAIVTVNRENAADRFRSVKILKSLLKRHISILIFPEGTFNQTGNPLKSFYDGAFRIAIETQTPIKPVLFLDMYDRMPYGKLFSLTPGKSRSIFMEEVPVSGLTMQDIETLKNKVYALMEERLLYYKASWISRSPTQTNENH